MIGYIRVDSSDNPWHHMDTRVRNGLIVRLLLDLGIRRGELLGLEVRDIDFRKNELTIHRTPDNKRDPRIEEPNTKTLARVLPIGESREGRRFVKLSTSELVGASNLQALGADPNYEPSQGVNFLQAVQYGPSLVNGMKFLKVGSIAGTYGLKDAGELLADAYEAAIAEHERKDWLEDIKKLRTNAEEV